MAHTTFTLCTIFRKNVLGANKSLFLTVQLLGIPILVLQQGLTHRKIEAKAEEVTRPFHSEYRFLSLADFMSNFVFF